MTLLRFPAEPEPHTIEVEPTNHCSARCSFCPHPRMKREKGFMDPRKLERFLDDVRVHRPSLWLNRAAGELLFPRVVFAGLGEPTLHRELPELVRAAVERQHATRVVTNGAHLGEGLVSRLLAAGLNSLAISLPTLDPTVYHATMDLDLSRVLPKIERALSLLGGAGIDVQIWRVLPPPGMPRETLRYADEFRAFEARYPFVRTLGPTEPWSRDDVVPISKWTAEPDYPEGGIFCANLFFTLSLAWDGACVMCCVDYHRITEPLGNAFDDGFDEVQQRRRAIHLAEVKPSLCRSCRKTPDYDYAALHARFLAGGERATSSRCAVDVFRALWSAPAEAPPECRAGTPEDRLFSVRRREGP
jgi:pyruvate-formate lyase-activating enzyme